MYQIYMLRCEDNSIYTGITTDIKRRFNEHKSKNKKCAKYTINHSALNLEKVWDTEDRILASKLEYQIKKLNKNQKEQLIKTNDLEKILGNKIEVEKYVTHKI